jgi:hypothetical protein
MKTALLGIVLIGLSFGVARSQSSPVPVPVSSSASTVPTASTARTGKAALALPPEKANPIRIVRFEKPPLIDGKLDDEIWKSAARLLSDSTRR